MAVMGTGDIVAGKDQQTSEPRQSIVTNKPENAPGSRPESARPRQAQMCAAMTEQVTDSSVLSQPQGFLRLVGCRQRKAGQLR
jgi:hypothetical protein